MIATLSFAKSSSQIPSRPIMVTDVARTIRTLGGTVWLVQKPDYGFVLRCEFCKKQVRIVILPLIDKNVNILNEPGVATFTVNNLPALEDWLKSLQK